MEQDVRADNPIFRTTVDAARQVLKRRFRVMRVVHAAYRQAVREEVSLGRVTDDLQTLIRLARAWARREYRSIPWRSILYVVAALMYFVNPVDLIPDALLGIGFVDDAAVIAAVVRALHKEVGAFRVWEAENEQPPIIAQTTRRAA